MNGHESIISFSKEIYLQLILCLEADGSGAETLAATHEGRIALINESIRQLRTALSDYKFTNEDEETDFFKRVVPDIISLLIYETEKHDLDCIKMIASPNLRMDLAKIKFERIDLFFKENAEFIRYYYSRSTYLDAFYFLRRHAPHHRDSQLIPEASDPFICPMPSYKVATMLAYSKVLPELEILFAPREKGSEKTSANGFDLKWTDSKSGLIELIYSLKEQGAFNHGHADVKTIADYFEKTFSVDLGNASSLFQKILSRKGGQTNYMDQLKARLVTRITEIDERMRLSLNRGFV